ncbi:MAG: hypothetical protein RLY93_20415 [Sumerlaeia bacterium]
MPKPPKTFSEHLTAAREALEKGDLQGAFQIRFALAWPGPAGDGDWRAGMLLLSELAGRQGESEFAEVIAAAARDANTPDALVEAAYQLTERGLPQIGASAYRRAHALLPDHEGLLAEYAYALGAAVRHQDAYGVLREARAAREKSRFLEALMGHYALLCGDLALCRAMPLGEMVRDPREETRVTASKLVDGLLRADSLLDRGQALDSRDLRGWHYALTGGILTHLSPFGFDEGMNGRYAFIQDSPGRCRASMDLMVAVLEALCQKPERVFHLPGVHNEALARAAAGRLGLPLEPWPAQGRAEPGLIAVYDLDTVPLDCLDGLVIHRPGQILWSHAASWTTEPPFAADITTFLYQTLRPIAGGDAVAMTREILAAEAMEETAADRGAAVAFAGRVADLSGEWGTAALRGKGIRRAQPVGSPVPSSYFA